MKPPRILFAHGRSVICAATRRVLEANGFEVSVATGGNDAMAQLEKGSFDGLVVDVALPERPGYEFAATAKEFGVRTVILVASVYRRTAYKRRPTRLYGADDYVEIHHLGDHLPARLRVHLGLEETIDEEAAHTAYEQLRGEGDRRFDVETPAELASLIAADVMLYNGELLAEAESADEARALLETDLEAARKLFAQVKNADPDQDLVGEAMLRLLARFGEGVGASG